jgi:hypothetical protein
VPTSLRLLLWVSVAATAACMVAHVLTFAGIAVQAVWWLLPLLFILWPMVVWHWRRVPRRNLASEIFGNIPRWMKFGAVTLVLYAFVNFFACRLWNESGRPERLADGRYVLRREQTVIRELTPMEFRGAQAVVVRLLTGEMLVIFALAALTLEACWIKNGPAMADRKM